MKCKNRPLKLECVCVRKLAWLFSVMYNEPHSVWDELGLDLFCIRQNYAVLLVKTGR